MEEQSYSTVIIIDVEGTSPEVAAERAVAAMMDDDFWKQVIHVFVGESNGAFLKNKGKVVNVIEGVAQ